MAPKKVTKETAEEDSYSYVTDEEEAPSAAVAAKAAAAKAVPAKAVAAKAAGSGPPRAVPKAAIARLPESLVRRGRHVRLRRRVSQLLHQTLKVVRGLAEGPSKLSLRVTPPPAWGARC